MLTWGKPTLSKLIALVLYAPLTSFGYTASRKFGVHLSEVLRGELQNHMFDANNTSGTRH